MNRIFCVVVAGVTRWLTGTAIGEDYGKVTGIGRGHPNPGIVFGIIGAFLGIYLFPWAAIGAVSSSSLIGAAVLGSMTLVGFARQIRGEFWPSRTVQ